MDLGPEIGNRLIGNGLGKCPKCHSRNFVETVSKESCPDCGYVVDYWGEGCNDVAKAYYKKQEEEYRWQQHLDSLQDYCDAHYDD